MKINTLFLIIIYFFVGLSWLSHGDAAYFWMMTINAGVFLVLSLVYYHQSDLIISFDGGKDNAL